MIYYRKAKIDPNVKVISRYRCDVCSLEAPRAKAVYWQLGVQGDLCPECLAKLKRDRDAAQGYNPAATAAGA